MNIEQAIQQPKFRNEHQKAMINMAYTANWLSEKIKRFLEPYDITPQQFNILRILRGSQTPLSTLQIRNRMLDKMSDTSRIVDRLIAKDLVTKTISAADRRLVDVAINEKGLALLSSIDEKQQQLDDVMITLSVDEAKMLNELLDKLRDD